MKKLFFFFLFSQVILARDCVDNELIIKINNAITQCSNKYLSKTNQLLSPEIDRVYVHKFDNGHLGIIFANGEVGSFGKRNLNYKTLLSCGMTEKLKIKFLSIPMQDPIINVKSFNNYHTYDAEVLELLFLKREDGFKYEKSQILVDKTIDLEKLKSKKNIRIE